MLADGKHNYPSEYLKAINIESFGKRIVFDEGIIAEETLLLLDKITVARDNALNIHSDLDKFYVNTENESVTWVYYNPYIDASGQLVYNHISFKWLFDALNTVVSFYENIRFYTSFKLYGARNNRAFFCMAKRGSKTIKRIIDIKPILNI